jgi:hypothetical protein
VNTASPAVIERRGASSALLSRAEKALVVIFLVTLPLANPWVRGDGVGYYAYVRSMMIEGRLDFEKDWLHGNESFVMSRVGADGQLISSTYTETGHIANLWSVGPSLLWAPFLLVTHLVVLSLDRLGAHVPADGFSSPYLITMACATAFYGFLGLWLSFRLARNYFAERWALLATLGIWWASSLPAYMYFNPSWSHAHSAFAVALFLFYWHRTRGERTSTEWAVLGLLSGLLVDVYYPNGALLLIPLLEGLQRYWQDWKSPEHGGGAIPRLLLRHVVYVSAFLIALLPTLVSRRIIFGSPFRTGYAGAEEWSWRSPAFWNILFSSDHGMLTWTPILVVALIGLIWFLQVDRTFAVYLWPAILAFYGVIALHPAWDGLSSFGSRFFISLTPLFVIGTAAALERGARYWKRPRAYLAATSGMVALLVMWNLGFLFQWGTQTIPARGPISWKTMVHNQFTVVPARMTNNLERYFLRRRDMMHSIEQQDVERLRQGQTSLPQELQ